MSKSRAPSPQHSQQLNLAKQTYTALEAQEAVIKNAQQTKASQDQALAELVLAENATKQQWEALHANTSETALLSQKELLEFWNRNTHSLFLKSIVAF
ncbi:hypothetical protein OH492_26570 [Vibrio chagasii]|nr:hypothetical protein [Vibrio chagasii]